MPGSGDASKKNDATARDHAQALRADHFSAIQGTRFPVDLESRIATQWSITCNDAAMTRNVAGWEQELGRLSARYPFAGGFFSMMPCLSWGGPSVTRPPLEPATRAGTIVVLQSEFDPQTPLAGARASLAALPNARMLLLEGEITHAIGPPYGNTCIDVPVGEYLLSGAQPPRETRCQGRPIPEDRPPAAAADPLAAPFRNPALARRALEGLHPTSPSRR